MSQKRCLHKGGVCYLIGRDGDLTLSFVLLLLGGGMTLPAAPPNVRPAPFLLIPTPIRASGVFARSYHPPPPPGWTATALRVQEGGIYCPTFHTTLQQDCLGVESGSLAPLSGSSVDFPPPSPLIEGRNESKVNDPWALIVQNPNPRKLFHFFLAIQ